jgi:hypothetical protein
VTVDVSQWEFNARNLRWVDTPDGRVRPVNADGKDVNFSHSFSSTVDDCKLKGWFQKVGCAPRGSSEAADRGGRIHELWEYYGKMGEWPGDEFTIRQHGVDVKPTKLDWACARALVDAGEFPTGKGLSYEEVVRLPGVFTDGKGASMGCTSIIDVFGSETTFASRFFNEPEYEGLYFIGDFKTRGSFDWAPTTQELAYDKQLGLYVVTGLLGSYKSPFYGKKDLHLPERGVVVCHFNVGTRTIETSVRHNVMSKETSENVWRGAQQSAVALLDLCRIDKVADVPYSKSACRKYGGCDHASRCPHSPQNSKGSGRIGALFGLAGKTPPQKSEISYSEKENRPMGTKFSLKDKMKKRKGTSGDAKPEAKPAEPKKFSLKSKVKKTKAPAPKPEVPQKDTRTQIGDTGPQRGAPATKKGRGEPIVSDAMVEDVKKVVSTFTQQNGVALSEDVVRMACQEVGADFATARASLSEAYPALDFGDTEDEVTRTDPNPTRIATVEEVRPEKEDVSAAETVDNVEVTDTEDETIGLYKWGRLESIAANEEGWSDDALEAIDAISQGTDAAEAGALAAIYTQVLRGGGKAARANAQKAARDEYNGMQEAHTYLDYTNSKERIGRFTKAKLVKTLDLVDFMELDAEGETVILVPANWGDVERVGGLEEKKGVPSAECPVGLERGNHPVDAEGCTCDVPKGATSVAYRVITEESLRAAAEVPPEVPELPDPRPANFKRRKAVLINAVPLNPRTPAVDFSDWLRPYMDMVEKDLNVPYWNSCDHAKGAGYVASRVSRDLQTRGVDEVLPPILVVDKYHKLWHPIRDLLGNFDCITFIQGV